MLDYTCRVLLIEDEPEDVSTIQTILSNVKSTFFQRGFELAHAETLTEAKQILLEREFDVILLDLMLPDSRQIGSLQELQELVANVPIIVQTALEDEIVAVKALELGASGYLPKVASDRNLLLYAIRSAIERQRQLANIEQSQQQQEVDVLGNLLLDMAHVNSNSYLLQEMPDVFEELKETYYQILARFVEQKLYKVEYNLSEQINIFVEQLGYLQATPRDAVELHSAVLKKQSQFSKNARALTIEGRYLLLELIGRLAAYYRRYYIGLNRLNQGRDFRQRPKSD